MAVKNINIRKYSTIEVISPEFDKQLENYRVRIGAIKSGYPVLTDWHPLIPEGWGQFQALDAKRNVIYRGNAESWAYSHHHTVAKFKDKYVTSWSNGFLHEDYVGQEVHYASSVDGANWSEPSVLAATPVESGLVRNNAGLYASEDTLYCYVCVAKDYGRDVSSPGMVSIKEQHIRLDVYKTTDLENWTHYENICPNIWLFGAPHLTKGGKLMCCGHDITSGQGMVLLWDDASDPAAPPRVVYLEMSLDGVCPSEGAWYQTDDGRIFMYQRDEAMSGFLALSWSDDEGETWSDLLRTNFPNSLSLAYAGQLNDGRYYIVGNNYNTLLDREHLLIAISDDGYVFDRQYTIVEDQTTRRINGRHKEDGYHYPNCCADGDKLIVVYSVNKEDVEAIILDTNSFK